MNQLTFNNQQLLFVKVPIEAYSIKSTKHWVHYKIGNLYKSIAIIGQKRSPDTIGSIQKENGVVSTTILDEALKELSNFKALDGLPVDRADLNLISIVEQMEDSGIPLQEGNKYVVLKIK